MKEVETVFPQSACDSWNNGFNSVPFTYGRRDYKDLVIQGNKWMKAISRSCILVAAVIITIAFVAAFLASGGNNQLFVMNRKLFKVFIISDALSLLSSTISVLMFLGILTSRYAKQDFLKSLPTKMIISLSTLIFSIVTMVIAFSAVVSTMLPGDSWIGCSVILAASIPVALVSTWMHFPLLVDVFMSTYGPSIFNRKVKPWL